MLDLQRSSRGRRYGTGRFYCPDPVPRSSVWRGFSHVTLTLSHMLSSNGDGMRTSSGKEDWRVPPCQTHRRPPACFMTSAAAGKIGPWEPTPKLSAPPGSPSPVGLVCTQSSVLTDCPCPGLDPPRQRCVNAVIFQTRTSNKDLLASRWAPLPDGSPPPESSGAFLHSCCKS